jgi:serpin B
MGRRTLGIAVAILVLTAACGSRAEHLNAGSARTTVADDGPATSAPHTTTTIAIGKPTSTGGDPKVAAQAVTQFGTELFAAVRGDTNAVISPASVAIALAMLEPGANGAGLTELDRALHVADPAAFHSSMTALRASLESATTPPKPDKDTDFGDLKIAIANATYMQGGYTLLPAYLGALGRYYGPVLKTVDFAGHGPEAVADINKVIADATNDKIKDVLKQVDPATVLALVNALYLKASWLTPFDTAKTNREAFTRADGSKVTADLMHGRSDASTSGDGWVAARKLYSSRLAADFVLPDNGRFDAVAGQLGAVFPKLTGDGVADGSTLVVPKLTTRFRQELKPALNQLGIKAVYDDGNLMRVADDSQLVVDQAVHATFLAMDEQGTEAAAATVITATAVSARSDPPTPVPVVLDRPFFFRIVDLETGATLFVGQVMDPTAG